MRSLLSALNRFSMYAIIIVGKEDEKRCACAAHSKTVSERVSCGVEMKWLSFNYVLFDSFRCVAGIYFS